jgi:hypothetical protein
VCSLSACGGASDSTPSGTYEHTLTPTEQARFMELAQRDFAKNEIATRIRFEDDHWMQSWIIDGEPWTTNGHDEGDRGTYTVDGDRLVTTNDRGIRVTYRWSTDGDVLSLTALEDSAGAEDLRGVRVATEHDFVRAAS